MICVNCVSRIFVDAPERHSYFIRIETILQEWLSIMSSLTTVFLGTLYPRYFVPFWQNSCTFDWYSPELRRAVKKSTFLNSPARKLSNDDQYIDQFTNHTTIPNTECIVTHRAKTQPSVADLIETEECVL